MSSRIALTNARNLLSCAINHSAESLGIVVFDHEAVIGHVVQVTGAGSSRRYDVVVPHEGDHVLRLAAVGQRVVAAVRRRERVECHEAIRRERQAVTHGATIIERAAHVVPRSVAVIGAGEGHIGTGRHIDPVEGRAAGDRVVLPEIHVGIRAARAVVLVGIESAVNRVVQRGGVTGLGYVGQAGIVAGHGCRERSEGHGIDPQRGDAGNGAGGRVDLDAGAVEDLETDRDVRQRVAAGIGELGLYRCGRVQDHGRRRREDGRGLHVVVRTIDLAVDESHIVDVPAGVGKRTVGAERQPGHHGLILVTGQWEGRNLPALLTVPGEHPHLAERAAGVAGSVIQVDRFDDIPCSAVIGRD